MTRELRPAILIAWVFAAVVLTLVGMPGIAHLWFPDPDDAMRLLEVRDWLGGQSWWDVGQHRLNGGVFPMHWSRLVDLPLAAVMLVFDPVLGPAASTRIAMTIVPLTTLLAIMAVAALLTNRLAGTEQARLAMLLAALSIPVIYQVKPMRIDHHGWQIALALAATLALIARPTMRYGALAGISLATLVTISLEGLPIAAILAGVAALAWAIEPARRGFLNALLGCFFVATLAWHAATRGPAMFAAGCDAMSPAWLMMIGVAAASVAVATAMGLSTIAGRIVVLAASGGACIATLLVMAPECLHGPFATLDPLVRTLWYDNVPEGLPIWRQTLPWAVTTIALPLVGLFGTVDALRRSAGDSRHRWLLMLAVLVPAILLSCLVNRTGATANALALPGAACLLLKMLRRARGVRRVLPRIAATTGALIVASPGMAAGSAMTIIELLSPPKNERAQPGASPRASCKGFDDIRALGRLPAGVVFLPLDITPDLIATTAQKAISGGYHRNAGAMHAVLAAFTGTPADAERVIRRSQANYVAGCPFLNETEAYKHVAPDGLWARLERGERFDWLRPIAIPGSSVLAWRVVRPAPEPLPRAAAHP